MAYFRVSQTPSRLKDESEDVRGNRYVISAADYNKHDEEIRAIQRALGFRRPIFPGPCFSGTTGCVDASGFSGFSAFSGFSTASGCYSAASGFSCSTPSVTQDVYGALSDVFEKLSSLRDDYLLMDGGMVACHESFIGIPGTLGKITFPSDWPITTLSEDIPDDSVDDEEIIGDIDELQVADASDMPDTGYVTLINDALTGVRRQRLYYTKTVHQLFPASPIAGCPTTGSDDVLVLDDGGQHANLLPSSSVTPPASSRNVGMFTNVEILFYGGIDKGSNKLLRVKRKQQGTTASRHCSGDLVFKGRLSINASPAMYATSGDRADQVDCHLRADGSIKLRVRTTDAPEDWNQMTDETSLAYAQYMAILVRLQDEIPPFVPAEVECG